jgi:hypothetical protein
MGTSGQGARSRFAVGEMAKTHESWAFSDGARGTRTPDLLGAMRGTDGGPAIGFLALQSQIAGIAA